MIERLRAILDAQALVKVPEMHLYCVLADTEIEGDLAVALASVDMTQQLFLAFRKRHIRVNFIKHITITYKNKYKLEL